jgi:transposase
MAVLSGAGWAELKAALDRVRSGEGRRFRDERRTVGTVVRRLRDGARWRAVPAEPGPRRRAAQLRIRRSRGGTWARLLQAPRAAGRPNPAEVFLGGTAVRAHAEAAGAGGARLNALGRSRGGYGTRARVACGALGRALAFVLLPGRGHEPAAAPGLLAAARALGPVGRVVRDRAYSSARWRSPIEAAGAEAVVPSQPAHRRVPHDGAAYRRRHRVENLWARLKERRAVAIRYDETAASFLGALHLAAALDRLHNRP